MSNIKKTNNKMYLTFGIICLIFLLIVIRIVQIQVIKHDEYSRKAMNLATRDIEVEPVRGDIFDRNMEKLAYSVKYYDLWVSSKDINLENGELSDGTIPYRNDVKLKEQILGLADIIGVDSEEFYRQLDSGKIHFRIKRWVDKATVEEIRKLGIRWLAYAEVYKRIYPYENFASHLIGHTDGENSGITGLEMAYNTQLKGVNGKLLVETDIRGKKLALGESTEYEAIEGLDLVLTIDEMLQKYLEDALLTGLENSKAKRVTGIMMDTKTGEILAMGSKPDFNLNNPKDLSYLGDEAVGALSDAEKIDLWYTNWKNPAISDTYEPGSIFKLITASAALEENVVTPETTFDEYTGVVEVDGQVLKCWSYKNPHGHQTLTQGLENSCNPVFVKTQQMMGKDTFFDYVEAFGFTEKTGIAIPAEAYPIFRSRETLKNVEAATMSFGHGISVTPLQMVTAINAIANDGKLLEPLIVKQMIDSDGTVVYNAEPVLVRQVISEKTSIDVRLMMESVVDNGSGSRAKVDGIRIGGKTGTSEKIIGGEYSDNLAISSFAAIAPVENPEITLLIVVDEPRTSNFGSVIAAPIAHDILVDSFRYLGIKPNAVEASEILQVPNFSGYTVAAAIDLIEDLGFEYQFASDNEYDPNAEVLDQYPAAGTSVREKSLILIKY